MIRIMEVIQEGAPSRTEALIPPSKSSGRRFNLNHFTTPIRPAAEAFSHARVHSCAYLVDSRGWMPGRPIAGYGGVSGDRSPTRSGYWDVKDIRPGMKGKGQTVMVGTRLDEFEAEVLGVMRDVSPGRDMILCRLERLQPGARGDYPGDERQPDLRGRQAAGGGGLRVGVRQGPDRGSDAVFADGGIRAGE